MPFKSSVKPGKTSSPENCALQALGVHEAVLLDSGFSTSLVYGNKILVTGHTSPGIPSRPVPHALVLFGKPAPSIPRLALVGSR